MAWEKQTILDASQNARYQEKKGDHRLMITFPFDGSI